MTKKGKSPIVLLHGLGGSPADWKDVAKSLAKSREVYAPDLPGSATGKTFADDDLRDFHAWLEEWMTKEGLGAAALAGHSLGGRIAAELAAKSPARVSQLALLSPLGGTGYGLADKLKWKAMSRRTIVQNVPEAQMRRALSVGFTGEGAGMQAFVDRALASRTGAKGDATAKALERSVDWLLASPPIADRLKGSKLPVLVVSGEKDPLSPPSEARAVAKAVASSRLELLPKAGHYALIETPARVSELLLDFLDD